VRGSGGSVCGLLRGQLRVSREPRAGSPVTPARDFSLRDANPRAVPGERTGSPENIVSLVSKGGT